ncbi:sugar ABC transporter ATP-binding protein [Patulibacter sp. SYSU D01012]|uniref:sugar ABC transporter ATP-binding protein n=1 Tax=Patulibacter sp. SYSU D01012 TaxID=2817381 RepID=UPI001B30A0E1|nr:sugar ABC transporter ATP-binding protein [Patulibacter sp. SYSU D01012]
MFHCTDVSKRFGATQAVAGVSLEIPAGQVLALMGENGAGKSSFMAMVAGEVVPDTGELSVDGHVLRGTPADSRGAGVAIVHQELSLFPNLTVGENICLGRTPRGRLGLTDHRALRARATAALERVGFEIDPDRPVADLGAAERQLVEVAKAIATTPKLLILDEPTSSLEQGEVQLLHRAVQRLTAEGTAVIFVSHRLDEVFQFSDLIAVMRTGALVAAGPKAEWDEDRLIQTMVGREIEQLYPPRAVPAPQDATPVLELDGITGDGVHDITIAVAPGRIVGVSGLEGHGQHTVAELATGVRTPASGAIRVAGAETRLRSPRAALKAGVAYVPPNRREAGLFLPLSIRDNLASAAHRRMHPRGVVSPGRETREIEPVIERLHLRYSSTFQRVADLSGGNQQKVLFGRWLLAGDLRVLVLDDPTRGVDVGARAEIYRLLRELTEDGMGVLLVSTDMLELLGLADEIHVMYEGRITGTVDGEDATEESIMALATGRVAA